MSARSAYSLKAPRRHARKCVTWRNDIPKVNISPPILGGRKDEAPSGDTLEASEATAHGLSFPTNP